MGLLWTYLQPKLKRISMVPLKLLFLRYYRSYSCFSAKSDFFLLTRYNRSLTEQLLQLFAIHDFCI